MDSDALDNRASVSAIRKGNRKAFSRVVELYYNDLYWYAISLGRNDDLAKDLTQEVFLKLWKKRKKLKDGVIIKGWLYMSVRNKFLDHIKKHKGETYLLETAYAETLDDVIESEGQDSLRRRLGMVEEEINRLPKKCLQVFTLSKKEGLTNNEIADYLGLSIKTVEGHISKALKILREKLKEKAQFLFVLISHCH